ncbi:TetR family transcriptional regulator [Micromonospora craterilacus]|uniref:TetR family transcriptional regulator n=1 Tax=Micromonospora craterilacus TaxID=1655439 RepID=A0A2W2FDK3_9ACTN|nr:TetR/AcrR family transcriptional regulator [Micromonospora craterilacus]PZG19747.1 TetR family transcriptional regulator [Micromonospora craterilacus]
MRRAEQREQTRQALVRESRQLFATLGYGAVGLSQIVAAAGVTKGALYHHFDSKADVFRAVLEQVQQEVAEQVVAAAEAHDDSWARLSAGCRAFLTASTAPEVQQIMLIDGPAVLGWAEWRALDEAASAHHLAKALADLVADGAIPPQPVEPLAHLLSGAMNEAALWLATTTSSTALEQTWAALARLLDGLRAR